MRPTLVYMWPTLVYTRPTLVHMRPTPHIIFVYTWSTFVKMQPNFFVGCFPTSDLLHILIQLLIIRIKFTVFYLLNLVRSFQGSTSGVSVTVDIILTSFLFVCRWRKFSKASWFLMTYFLKIRACHHQTLLRRRFLSKTRKFNKVSFYLLKKFYYPSPARLKYGKGKCVDFSCC